MLGTIVEVTTVTSVTPTISKNPLDSRNFVVINWCHRSSAYRRQMQSESEANMSEQNATAAAPAEEKKAKGAAAPKDVPNKFKIAVAALPFVSATMALPKSIKPKPFPDGGGGQIQIVKGLLQMGVTLPDGKQIATQAHLPFGVALRWNGNNTKQLIPAVQLPKLASDRFEAAIRTDDVATKAALDTLERDIAAMAVKFYQSEIKKSERTTGMRSVAMSAAVQTFDAASLGISIELEDRPAKKAKKGATVPDADGDDAYDEQN